MGEKLSDYELERLRRIKENNDMLATLHIAPLTLLTPKHPVLKTSQFASSNRPVAKARAELDKQNESIRRSKRLRGLTPSGSKHEEKKEESFMNDEAEYISPRKRQQLSEESYGNRMERARHQHLGIAHADSTDSDAFSATFTVRGSTGKMYTVTISQSPKCTCPDQRIRKVMCKHILFVLLTSFALPVEHPVFARKGQGAHINDDELRDMFKHLEGGAE